MGTIASGAKLQRGALNLHGEHADGGESKTAAAPPISILSYSERAWEYFLVARLLEALSFIAFQVEMYNG